MKNGIIEIWSDVLGYEGLYMVSNLGRIKSLPRLVIHGNGKRYFTKERILIPQNRIAKGLVYKKIDLTKNKITKQLSIHRIVCEAFISNPEKKLCVNHINGNPSDNRMENLEWVTHKENTNHWLLAKNRKSIRKEYNESIPEYLLSDFCTNEYRNIINEYHSLLLASANNLYGLSISEQTLTKMIWKRLPEYEDFYIISEYGHVASLPRIVLRENQHGGKTMRVKGSLLRQHISIDRFQVPISKNGVYKKLYPHQLVAKAFLKKPFNAEIVNHKDGNPLNNHYTNLEYITQSQNQLHCYKIGLRKKVTGKNHWRSKNFKRA